MKTTSIISLFFLFTFGYFNVSHSIESNENYSGYITIKSGFRYIKINNSLSLILGQNKEITSQINKLQENDFVSGFGLKERSNSVILQTIDFIGLSRFLGTWLTPRGFMQVRDFSQLNFYSQNSKNPTLTSNLSYSIIPSQGNSWGLFLTDNSQIYFSNLYMSESKAIIQFFDSKTGAIISEMSMSKISR